MVILEKLISSMIDICTKQHSTLHLKEDIGYFRNLSQHQSMNLLQRVMEGLRNKCEGVYKTLEKDIGEKKLITFLSDDFKDDVVNETEATGEELLYLAYISLDQLEEKNKIMPRVQFYLDIMKNILDTLRSNHKLLTFYNDTASKVFAFCRKYKCKKEYRRISDTLHSHLNQILSMYKQPDTQSKIPFPINLHDDKQVTQVLTLRKEQLEVALEMEEWTDAYRVCTSIYQLMSMVSKKKSEQQIKQIYSEFYDHFASVFYQSKLYLFHAYALQNVYFLNKSVKNQDQALNQFLKDRFVLSALSIPLNNKLTNFERLSFNFVTSSMREFDEVSLTSREELFSAARMLNVDGKPSRDAIMHYINIENILGATSKSIQDLFALMENESSPFIISKKGKAALEAICKDERFAIYKPFIAKTLSVRILQKCKTFFKNMKMEKLAKMLPFFDDMSAIESFLYWCNNESLVKTSIYYPTHD
mmetsp:Transcript_15948/g.24678  ORF Transcript_15948/g.24678 Transcript_15948/m.24678 type:complete len:474 (-) Transcript_15948:1461-2882(-)